MIATESNITFDPIRLARQLLSVQAQNQHTTRLDGWFYIQEIRMAELKKLRHEQPGLPPVLLQAKLLQTVCQQMPLTIRPDEIFAGTQDDAFARTYALINPEFRVETFAGYCDPMGVYGDITPAPELGFTAERIQRVRDFWAGQSYAIALQEAYATAGPELAEVVYFTEQVTGHIIPDFRPALAHGVMPLIKQAHQRAATSSGEQREFYQAAEISLSCVLILAERYATLATEMAAQENDAVRRDELELLAATCARVPRNGAANLYEAMQGFILLWMAMTVEQSPNPYAFSVGNLDRILQPYYANLDVECEVAIELTRHLLALYNVGDRNWAISQDIMVGGRDEMGNDLTCAMTTIVLEAFYRSNYPQPALSVKLHAGTPEAVYAAMEPFFTTPGSVTPSLFNDDILFDNLRKKEIAEADLPDYAIAGCQEPLIMGKESGNTTNSWLNLAKVLELTLHDGKSAITGTQIGLRYSALGLNPANPLQNMQSVKAAFWQQLDHFLPMMEAVANACTRALATLPVPFVSCFMGGLVTGYDMRNITAQGTKYNASGCLIHGLSVVADSFAAIETLAQQAPAVLPNLVAALQANFAGDEALKARCIAAPKYGNDLDLPDSLAVEIARDVSLRISNLRNPWGNQFLADWSTPSTHLLYGYWVGATPDGRMARQMLGYGIDPTAGMATKGLPPRIQSMHKLPYDLFLGGYASHIGLHPQMISNCITRTFIIALRDYVISPLFGYGARGAVGGYYVYFNIDSADHLRAILANPTEMAPSGIYIMRIHGTFVNFLDLSPAIQEDIIMRLDQRSTNFTCKVQ